MIKEDIDKYIITKISSIWLKRSAEDMLKIMKPIDIYTYTRYRAIQQQLQLL